MRCIFDDVRGDDVSQCFSFFRCDHDDVVLLDYYIKYVLVNGVNYMC